MRKQKLPTAKEQELAAASRRTPRAQRTAPRDPLLAWLLRRGIDARVAEPDLPFPKGFPEARQRRFAELLDSYAFRLFVRGAILEQGPFAPSDATRYVDAVQARSFAESMVKLGLAARTTGGRFRLAKRARNFGCTLEWYVARELSRRLGFAVATGLLWRAKGVGGDLDVLALADGRMCYLELKSGPPKHLTPVELSCFLDRVHALRPDVSVIALDTSLRLSDKVLPMLSLELERRAAPAQPRRIVRDVWAVTPHLYLASAKWDLVGNIILALAEGLKALAPA